MTSTIDDLSLDPMRDAWLTPRESANWDALALLGQFNQIGENDVAAVFGAASGGIASWLLNECNVANVTIVEDRSENDVALRRNFQDRLGASRVYDDPVASVQSVIANVLPTVVVLDLGNRTTDRDVIMALTGDIESVDQLIVIYEPYGEQEEALHNVIKTWYEGQDKFISTFGAPSPVFPHRPDARVAWYAR